MIPWDEFKTPQDAYEWAKMNAGEMKYECVVLLGCTTHCVCKVGTLLLVSGQRSVRR